MQTLQLNFDSPKQSFPFNDEYGYVVFWMDSFQLLWKTDPVKCRMDYDNYA
jgi:hypothetical protein